jgi:hypothetical protein
LTASADPWRVFGLAIGLGYFVFGFYIGWDRASSRPCLLVIQSDSVEEQAKEILKYDIMDFLFNRCHMLALSVKMSSLLGLNLVLREPVHHR